MNDWRKVRGMLSTALAWALPWAVVGGAIMLTWGVLTAHPLAPLRAYFTDTPRFLYVGAILGGGFGAISGFTFAALLARRERASDLATLSMSSAVRIGAISGASSVAFPMLLMAIGSPRSPFMLAPVALFTAAAGAISAYAMITLARNALPRASATADKEVVGASAEPAELAAARIEVERALSQHHDPSTFRRVVP